MYRKLHITHISLQTLAIAIVCGLILASCGKDDLPDKPNRVAERAVVVYMVSTNTLSGNDSEDISEMLQAARAGGLKDGRLLIYHQRYNSVPMLKEITAEGIDTLKKYDNSVSSLSIARMKGVLTDVKAEIPAKEYGIILWSHGNGWLRAGQGHTGETPISSRAFGEEKGIDNTTRYMDVESLAAALRGQDLAFAYFDCCYMGGIEVLYDLKDVVPRLVASVAEIPAAGMPYHLTLPHIMASGSADLEGSAKKTYEYYNSMIYNTDRTCTMSVYDMSNVSALSDALKELYSWHPKTHKDFTPQKFMIENICYHFDLRHYVENLYLPDETDEVKLNAYESSKQAVFDAIEKVVTYQEATSYLWNKLKIEHHCGISTQFLKSKESAYTRGYNETAWWQDVANNLFD